MRIIAGKHRGRKLEVGKLTPHVRPTSGFTREAIFNILTHGEYSTEESSPYRGKRVVDLCCGSGAFGLEALSRGASHVLFVDMDHHTLLSAKANAERLDESDSVSYLRANVSQLPPALEPFSLVFLDPPYFGNLIGPALASLQAGGWITPESLIVIEHDAREQPNVPPAFRQVDERRYGRAYVRLLRMGDAA